MTDNEFYLKPAHKEESYPFDKACYHEELKAIFPSYIFSRRVRGQARAYTGVCTNCGNNLSEDDMLNIEVNSRCDPYVKITSTEQMHNFEAYCPHCGCRATLKNANMLKTGASLNEPVLITFIYSPEPDVVYMREYTVFADYNLYNGNVRFVPEYKNEICRYRLEPGSYISEKSGWNYYADGWTECYKTTKRPTDYHKYNLRSAYCGSFEGTFLKYINIDDFIGHGRECFGAHDYRTFVKANAYVCYFAKYPQFEMLQKLHLNAIVNDVVYNGRLNARHFNWSATNVLDFLKLDKVHFNELMKNNSSFLKKELFDILKAAGHKLSFETANEYLGSFRDRAGQMYKLIGKYSTYEKVKNYISKKKIAFSDFADHLMCAEEVGFDLNEHNVIFPKNFWEAHDTEHRLKGELEFKNLPKAKKKALDKRAKRFEMTIGEYIFIFPHSVYQIINEGKALSHCVGGYAERHMNGKTNIIFMRKKEEQEKSLYTIEYDSQKNRIVQARGEKNKTQPYDFPESDFAIKQWLEIVSNSQTLANSGVKTNGGI